MSSRYTRDVETKVLEFTKTLKPNMTPDQVKKLFDELEEEHALLEAKIIIVGITYRSVLNDVLRKEEATLLHQAGMQFG